MPGDSATSLLFPWRCPTEHRSVLLKWISVRRRAYGLIRFCTPGNNDPLLRLSQPVDGLSSRSERNTAVPLTIVVRSRYIIYLY